MRRKLIGSIIAATLVASASALAQSIASAAPAATGAPSPAASAPAVAGPTRVGIVNIQQVIVNTTEGKREFETLNKKFEPKQTELSTLNKEIDGLKTQLQTQGDKMNEDAKATLVRQIESKQKVLQRNADDAQAEFNAQQGEIAQRILQKLGPVVDKFAKDNGYGLLIDDSNPWPQGQVLWATQSVDVTQPIIEAFNSQPAGAAAPSATPRPGGAAGPSATRPTTPRPAGPGAGLTTPKPTTPRPAGTTPPKQ